MLYMVSPPRTTIFPSMTNVEEFVCEIATGIEATCVQVSVSGS